MCRLLQSGEGETAGSRHIKKYGFCMLIRVLFYGVLAELAGTRMKTYNEVSSFGDLRLRIQDDFPEMVHYNFRYCHNKVLINGEAALKDGDEISLLPPFYGG